MRRWILAGLLSTVVAIPAIAQPPRGERGKGTPEQRAEMEQRFRARLAEVVKERLALTDDQARRLQEVDRRFETERRDLMTREMQVRRALRQQVAMRDTANQAVTSGLLDRMLVLQRQRTDLATREQRELATFLTPVQRAQLLALQADLHRRVMNAHRGGGGSGRSRNGTPPRPRP